MKKAIISILAALAVAINLCVPAAAVFEAPEYLPAGEAEYLPAETPEYVPTAAEPEPIEVPDPMGSDPALAASDPFITTAPPVSPDAGEIAAPDAQPCPDGEHDFGTDYWWQYNASYYDADGHWLYCRKCSHYIYFPHDFTNPQTGEPSDVCNACIVRKDDYSQRLRIAVSLSLGEELIQYMNGEYYISVTCDGFYDAIDALKNVTPNQFSGTASTVITSDGLTNTSSINNRTIIGPEDAYSKQIGDDWYGYFSTKNGYPEKVEVIGSINLVDGRNEAIPAEHLENIRSVLLANTKVTFYKLEDGTEVASVGNAVPSPGNTDDAPRCLAHHYDSNGHCTACGYDAPKCPAFDIHSVEGKTTDEARVMVEEAFGGLVNMFFDNHAPTDQMPYLYYQMFNPRNPNEILNFSMYYEDDVIYRASVNAPNNESNFYDSLNYLGNPVFMTAAQAKERAAADPTSFASPTYPSFDNGYYPDEACQIIYSFPYIDQNGTQRYSSVFIYNYDSSRSPSRDKQEVDRSIMYSDEYLQNHRFTVGYPYSLAYDLGQNTNETISIYGLGVDVAYNNLKAACPNLHVIPSDNYNNLSAYKYGMCLFYATEGARDRNLCVTGYQLAGQSRYGGSYSNYISQNMKSMLNALPASFDGFSTFSTEAELTAAGAKFTSKITVQYGGAQGYYCYATLTRNGIMGIYMVSNMEQTGYDMPVVTSNATACLIQVCEVPTDFSNISARELLDARNEGLNDKLVSIFGSDHVSYYPYSSTMRYPNYYRVSGNNESFNMTMYGADKIESLTYNTLSSSSAPNGTFEALPKIAPDAAVSDLNTSYKIKEILANHDYTVEYEDYNAFYYRRTDDIDKMKNQRFRIDMGDYYLEVSYPNYTFRYRYDENNNIVGRYIDTSASVNYSVTLFELSTKTPEALIPYYVGGGYIYIDPATGYVVKADPTVTDVTIPAEVEGVPVTGIDANAFEETSLSSIYIPVSVRYVAPEAFAGCGNLVITYQGSEAAWGKIFAGTLPGTVSLECENAVPGDLDGSGDANITDGVIMQKILAKIETDPAIVALADLDGNGVTDISDGIRLQSILAGLN